MLPRARAGVWAFTPWRAYVRVHAYTHPQLGPTSVKGQAGLRTARNARSRQHAQVAYCAAGHTARAANSRLGAGRRARPREYARVRGNASMHERGHVRLRTHLSTRAASARSGTCGTGCARAHAGAYARRHPCAPASGCAHARAIKTSLARACQFGHAIKVADQLAGRPPTCLLQRACALQ